MCLACSTPVRGENFGTECLADVLGPGAETTDPARPSPDRGIRTFALAAFGVAVLATALPWSRFGPGSDVFGAWTRSGGHWSLVAALAAIAGLALTGARLVSRLREPAWDVTIAGLGALVMVASLLSVLFPPAFSRPWLGPWFAVAAGAVACGTSILAARTVRQTSAGDI